MPTWDEHMANASTIDEVLGLAVGAGSICWGHMEDTGVFQDQLAGEVVEKAAARVRELLPTEGLSEYRTIYRAIGPDGVWCESSDPDEVRGSVHTARPEYQPTALESVTFYMGHKGWQSWDGTAQA
jgi:hypothetical protein